MKCAYCGTKTDYFTTTDTPICHNCAEEKSFQLCIDLGKYIEYENFHCDNICNDCIHNNIA